MNLFGFKKSQEAAQNVANEAEISAEAENAVEETVAPTENAVEVSESIEEANEISVDANDETVTDNAVEAIDVEVPPNSGIEPPRALFPGAFLGGEYEIKEVISRGVVNYYLADAGDYGSHDWKIVAQRRAAGQTVESGLESPFFSPATRFVDDEHEYGVWDFEPLQPLGELRAAPNDETYLRVMLELSRAFLMLENAGLCADLPSDSLWFDGGGNLKSLGFFDVNSSETEPPMGAIAQLSAFSSRFAKNSLAAGATLRLDDEFGALPFSREVKDFAQKLSDGEFLDLRAVVSHLENFAPFSRTEAALLSDVGMVRELNEDCGLIWKQNRAGHARNFEIEVLAVADGMGGHEGGEVASDATLVALETAISTRLNLDFSDNAAILAAMNEILGEVNDAVVRLTENPPYAALRSKPGSTLVCALRVGSRVFIGNVGDSRAYRWNAETGLRRLSKDHSYVQDLLDAGAITEDQAWGHPDGSVITSHIGMMRGLKKDVFLHLLSAGDRLVLVSDGVVDTLRDAEIEEIVAAQSDVTGLCAALVNAANDAGGFDNITVAALSCQES
ncbi:MAG TPA: protein phosphatase 2C domain-containing protein [Abditibacterium sp.]|jgi:protein phosphatase